MQVRFSVMLAGVMNANRHKTTTAAQENLAPITPGPDGLQTEFSGRLVMLSTGQPGLRDTLEVKVAPPQGDGGPPPEAPGQLGAEANPPIIDFIASDATLDRAGEIIVANGWRLDHYRRNPVFQNAHNYGDIIFTLGRALIAEVRDHRLFLRVLFATDINPMARLAYDMYRSGFLNAVSVGFLPIRWENGSEHTAYRRRYLEQELLEVSAVAVPANPNALALALKEGAIESADAQELQALLHSALKQTDARARIQTLLAAARKIAEALKPAKTI